MAVLREACAPPSGIALDHVLQLLFAAAPRLYLLQAVLQPLCGLHFRGPFPQLFRLEFPSLCDTLRLLRQGLQKLRGRIDEQPMQRIVGV